MHDIASFEFPAQIAGRRIQRIEIAVAAPQKNRALRHYRARQIDIERVGNGLIFRLHAV